MSSQHRAGIRRLVFGCLVIAPMWFVLGLNRPGNAGPMPAGIPQEPQGASKAAEERPADRAEIQSALDGFAVAFGKGNAKDVAAHWTARGEYISDDGTNIRGHAALEKDYAAFFAKNPDNALAVEVDSIRFPSRDNAVVEGHFKLRMGKKKELVVSRCSFLYAREDGKCLIAIARGPCCIACSRNCISLTASGRCSRRR